MSRCKYILKTGQHCSVNALYKRESFCKKHWIRYCKRQRRVRYERSKICQVILKMMKDNPTIPDKEIIDTIHALAGLSILNDDEIYEMLDILLAMVRYGRKKQTMGM